MGWYDIYQHLPATVQLTSRVLETLGVYLRLDASKRDDLVKLVERQVEVANQMKSLTSVRTGLLSNAGTVSDWFDTNVYNAFKHTLKNNPAVEKQLKSTERLWDAPLRALRRCRR
jgi:hypothetical protein